MTQTAEIASGFYNWFELNYFTKYPTDLRQIFEIGSLTGVDDCCENGLRSLKGSCHGNQLDLFNSHNFQSTNV